MRKLLKLQKYYHPVQSVIAHNGKGVSYTELTPAVALQPFIYCYWELKTTKRLVSPFLYRVIADGCIDIFFNLTDPEESSLMGFCNHYTEFAIEGTFHYVGIRFLPAVFPLLFRQDALEVRQQEIPLREVVPNLSVFIAQHIHNGLSTIAVKQTLDAYFLHHLANSNFQPDRRFFSALQTILQSKGTVAIRDLDTGISERQLRRLFDYYIGDSPKIFSKIVRFQHTLTEKSYHNHAFLDTYYDQAHFIKDFKMFYGETPSKVLW